MKHGLSNLELPVSVMSASESFARFVQSIVFNAEHFRTIYNKELGAFRKENRIRSRSHPVPELETDDEFVELPFWFWQKT